MMCNESQRLVSHLYGHEILSLGAYAFSLDRMDLDVGTLGPDPTPKASMAAAKKEIFINGHVITWSLVCDIFNVWPRTYENDTLE